MTSVDTGESAIQPEQVNEAILEKRLDDICEGLRKAIDREVENLRREGMPIYISDNGKVVDLQLTDLPE